MHPKISNRASSTKDGIPYVAFSKEEVETMAEPFKMMVVGKFYTRRLDLATVLSSLCSSLNVKDGIFTAAVDARYIFVRFKDLKVFNKAISVGRWIIGEKPMSLFCWTPSFHPGKESPIVPV
jgi:hypothetical protein